MKAWHEIKTIRPRRGWPAVCIRLRNRQVWDLGGIWNGGRGSVQHRPTASTCKQRANSCPRRASEMKGEHADEKHVAEEREEGRRRGKCRRGQKEERRACAVPVWVEEEGGGGEQE